MLVGVDTSALVDFWRSLARPKASSDTLCICSHFKDVTIEQ